MSSEHSQFLIIKDRNFDIGFFQWIKFLKLRFQTRQWASSLDFNSFVLHHSRNGTKNGVTVEFPFFLSEETFVRRMGFKAMSTIHIFWRIAPIYRGIQCPTPEGLPNETYWVFIMNEKMNCKFERWVSFLARVFESFKWENNIGHKIDGVKIIRSGKGFPVGIYVTMPYPMTFRKFFRRMGDRVDAFSYVTKTSKRVRTNQLTCCYDWGLFDRLDDGELY